MVLWPSFDRAIWCDWCGFAAGLHPDAILGDGNEEEVSPSERTHVYLWWWSKAGRPHVTVQKTWICLFEKQHKQLAWKPTRVNGLIQEFRVFLVTFVWLLNLEVLNLWLFENQMMLRRCSQGTAGVLAHRQLLASPLCAGGLRMADLAISGGLVISRKSRWSPEFSGQRFPAA